MTKNKEMTSDFADFLRDLGTRALDHLAERAASVEQTEAEGDAAEAAPLSGSRKRISAIAAQWRDMTPDEKEEFVDQVIHGAQVVAAAAPVVLAALKKKTRKKTKDKVIAVEESLADLASPDKKKKKDKKDKKDKDGKKKSKKK